MTVFMEEEGDVLLSIHSKELAESAIEEVLDYMDCPYECEVNLLLTTNEQIREMNREFRHVDRPTDVLSFPLVSYDNPGDFLILEEDLSCFHPDTGELMLGDIVLSKEQVLLQAEEYGHSVKREYTFLIVHSMLHLIGYDHMEEKERIHMEMKQKEIMDRLNILR